MLAALTQARLIFGFTSLLTYLICREVWQCFSEDSPVGLKGETEDQDRLLGQQQQPEEPAGHGHAGRRGVAGLRDMGQVGVCTSGSGDSQQQLHLLPPGL